jgi:hypothetical protein
LIVVADDGLFYSLYGASAVGITSIKPKRIEMAHIVVDDSLGKMSWSGLWSTIKLGWAPLSELPSLFWSAAAYQDDSWYLVGGDCLLRLSGRL